MGLINSNLWARKQTLSVLMSPDSFQHHSGTTTFHTFIWLLRTCFFYHISQKQNSFTQAIWGSLAFMKPVRSLSDDQPKGFPGLSHRDLLSTHFSGKNGCPCLLVSRHFRGGQQPNTPILPVFGQMTMYSPRSCANGLSSRLRNWT